MGAQPFHLPKPFLPLDWGIQRQAIGAGGPQGFQDARAGHATPWPYGTRFVNFVAPWPYGTPRLRAQQSAAPNIFSGHAPFYPLGYQKPMTGPGFTF
jgi:hypothetical protein